MSKHLTRKRQTKIVATLGPASSEKAQIKALVAAGADVFRLNFSHGTADDHRARVDAIRTVEKETGRTIGIIADLQGPKLRVGKFKNGSIEITEGMTFRFDLDAAPGDESRVQLPHPEILSVVQPGSRLLMDDGKVHAEVTKTGDGWADVVFTAGSKLSNNKGVNVPNLVLPIPALTEKDRRDLSIALDLGVDWIAQSFVQKPEDVAEARKLIGGRAGLIVKLEKPSALDHLDEIIVLTDALMVARGDLGVEIPPENVPSAQKMIVRKLRKAGKPVIVATQMLESMIDAPRPTRAEASDVATAIYDGADAVMLSAETAAGKYPVAAVEIMDRIAQSTERDVSYPRIMDAEHPDTMAEDASDAITAAAWQVAQTIRAAAIVNFTTSGSTALRTARQRPHMPIICLTEKLPTARRLMLSYGVHAVHTADVSSFDDMVLKAARIARQQEIAAKGQRIVITAGVPFGTPGSTNILRVAWVE